MNFLVQFKINFGTAAIEYSLIVALIAVVAISVLVAAGMSLIGTFDTIAAKLCLGACILVQQ